ncbi:MULTISPECIES: hypothetical protein [Streptomyces]|uniref:Uncharacterized protein n=1 Tax=Streptomyces edwardsiae TaxID=3075527 RepID=A0ABU2PW09_9ACTN|nr:hypothetical protein [Streptomyces sp. DSM 41636]MDT0395986.1 hypothetical protein [Streptomyces sp. DSM 41636]
MPRAEAPDVAPFSLAEFPAERDERRAAYALGITAVLITVITGAAVTLRDLRRRRGGERGV